VNSLDASGKLQSPIESNKAQEGSWLHFMGDSSLRIFYAAFVAHIMPLQTHALMPSRDFCYHEHRVIDKCSELDDKGAMCHRNVAARDFGYKAVTFQFATTMLHFPHFFVEAVSRRATQSDNYDVKPKPENGQSLGRSSTESALDAFLRSNMDLPDVLVIRNGAWEFSKKIFPNLNISFPVGHRQRMQRARLPTLEPGDTLVDRYRRSVREFLKLLESVYRVRKLGGPSLVIWLTGSDDPDQITSTTKRLKLEKFDPRDLAQLQRILAEEVTLFTSQQRKLQSCKPSISHVVVDIEPLFRQLPDAYVRDASSNGANGTPRCKQFSFFHTPGLFAESVIRILANTLSLYGKCLWQE